MQHLGLKHVFKEETCQNTKQPKIKSKEMLPLYFM